MKVRIQSVDDLKRIASAKLEDEFNSRYQQAILEGAAQGMAFVMYALEVNQHWKEVRQRRLFDDMLSLMQLGESWFKPFQASEMKKHIEEEYGIDFNQLFEKVSTSSSSTNFVSR